MGEVLPKPSVQMRRPLLVVALLYAGRHPGGQPCAAASVRASGCSLALALLCLAWERARPYLLCLLVFLTGWTNLTLRTAILSPCDLRLLLGEEAVIASVRGTLRETPALKVNEGNRRQPWRTSARIVTWWP